jgi:NDP-sugar pyrophosphorylase family protein
MNTIVILAAGLGSRFGGNKQLAEFGKRQLTLMEYNLLNAIQAGFTEVIFIIRPELETTFKTQILARIPKSITCHLAHQTLTNLPENCKVNPDRTKPLGTAHALWCCRHLITDSFVVINADDYYGDQAFTLFRDNAKQQPNNHFMVAYEVQHTLSEFGGVNRGLCQLGQDNSLISIEECEGITKIDGKITGIKSRNNRPVTLTNNTLISMNCWLFTPDIFVLLAQEIWMMLSQESSDNLSSDLTKNEYRYKQECYLPDVVMKQIQQQNKKVTVLTSKDQWFGLTFPEDTQLVNKKVNVIFDKS